MKKLFFIVLHFFIVVTLSGQSHGITYQAVIINPEAQEIPGVDITGNYMPDQTLTVRFTIQDESGVIEYQETQTTKTDAFGIINVTIGEGSITTLSPVIFMEIEWDGTPKDLKVDISLGETADKFTELSLQRLLFVPYAYHRNITATGTLIVDGATTLNNTLSVENGSDANLTGSLIVSGTSSLNNQVTINANVDGSDNQYDSYPLRVEGSSQGIGIRIDGSRSSGNNFITFWDSEGIQGRIEGQTSGDVLSDPQYIFDQSLYAAQVIAQAANLATALGASIIDPGNAIIEGINSGVLAAEIIAYNVFAFENLGVSYQSGAGDYAEWLPRLYPEEEIDFGQIVGVYGGKITRKTDDADMVMVVSKAPIVLGNMPSDSLGRSLCEKVGFMGQVPVWVMGKVKEGDFIIPYKSGSGFGKAVSPENLTIDMISGIVGRSWSSSDNSGINLINIVIGVQKNEWVGIIKSDKTEIDSLKKEIKQLKNQMNKTDGVLASLLPGYKQAMETEGLSTGATFPGKAKNVTPMATTTENIPAASEIFMSKESVAEGFEKAAQLLKAQGVDIDKNPFYSRFHSDPGYREKVISQVLRSWGSINEKSKMNYVR